MEVTEQDHEEAEDNRRKKTSSSEERKQKGRVKLELKKTRNKD